MDCEFRVGTALRFVVAGVGQEDVAVSFVQADTTGEYVASMVPLHGCVVVKPMSTADATRTAGISASDSVTTFAFVSPKTGKVYRNWSTCLSATRPDQSRAEAARADSLRSATARRDSIAEATVKLAVPDSTKRPAATKAPVTRRPR